MGPVSRHWPIEPFLRRQVALNIASQHLWENTPFENRLDYYQRYSAVLYGSGDRYWAICLRRPAEGGGFEAWPARPSAEQLHAYPTCRGPVDLPAVLAAQPAVDIVAYAAGENRVRVRTAAGEAEFTQPAGRGGAIAYRSVDGSDPLGWAGSVDAALLAGAPASGRAWAAAAAKTHYPDIAEPLLAYFRSRLAGDIAVFAAPDYDFHGVHLAGHGGLRPTDLQMPLLLAGPGVPHGRRELARSVDLMPTLLALLHRPIPAGLDGVDLLAEPTSQPASSPNQTP
jgi:hypothetical protein